MGASAGVILRAAQRTAQRSGNAVSRIIAGQPTPETHPELLSPGEIQPGILNTEFNQRRYQLADMLPSGGLAVMQAGPEVFMSGVIPYPYRQDSDFYYLTGILQPGSVAVVHSNARFTLFYPDHNAWHATWNGARLGREAALEFFCADEAYPMREMPERLSAMLNGASSVAMEIDGHTASPLSSAMTQLPGLVIAGEQGRLQSLRALVHRLRWKKSPAEINSMRRSAQAAAHAMTQCMKRSHPGVSEHGIASLFEWECKARGAQRNAYPPVVAGAADACTIHYHRNDKTLQGTDMLLLDGGCELHGYASDVTRTWPIGGKFDAAQAAVYGAVLETHRQVLAACRPGATLRQLHQLSVRLLSESLVDLGAVRGASLDAVIADQAYRTFYPHSVGHWLGIDTHDSSTVQYDRPLEPGVVLTIEPGLYIPDEEAFGSLAGIGVRIEDDVAVTEEGAEVLSAAVPVEINAIEELVGSGAPLR